MNNLFSKPKSKPSTDDIIRSIHGAFDTEVDLLLAEAKVQKEVSISDESLHAKVERLRKMGFTNASDVKQVKEEEVKIAEAAKINKQKKELALAIEYFSRKYPLYKFITRESVLKICKNYGLLYGSVGNYIGTVPSDKLDAMETFKIDEEDYAYTIETYVPMTFSRTDFQTVSLDMAKYYIKETKEYSKGQRQYSTHYSNLAKKSFIIAAPKTDFDLSNMNIKDFEIVKNVPPVPDPVVMQPVMYENKEYFLVVTAWGLEASDEEVVNQRMN